MNRCRVPGEGAVYLRLIECARPSPLFKRRLLHLGSGLRHNVFAAIDLEASTWAARWEVERETPRGIEGCGVFLRDNQRALMSTGLSGYLRQRCELLDLLCLLDFEHSVRKFKAVPPILILLLSNVQLEFLFIDD
ncbi:hypothetical protein CEXT_674831 [Caerostris extrusa]|uniref:Uncharacterized protein n=1 Tax=Caerostris extrusa TaxID=172846 RepID=A0AAV4WJE1_CAEEX|nr:hypothetical protein CEXT_674831 [Caerostris extrusa]